MYIQKMQITPSLSPVEIDGKETARVIAPYTEAELDKRQRRNSRKHENLMRRAVCIVL